MGDEHASKYSRSAGVSSYRKRRRWSRIVNLTVGLFLLAIIGSAAVMLGRQLMDYGGKTETSTQAVMAASSGSEAVADTQPLQPAQITLVATGDVVASGAVVTSGLKESGAYTFDHLFAQLKGELALYDIRVVSQETALAGSKFGFGNYYPLNAPQELGRAEVGVGFNVILRASDHTLDTGRDGVHNELQWWKSEFPELPILGVAEPEPEDNPGLSDYVNNVYIYEKDGFKVALLNHSWNIYGDDQAVVSALIEEKIAQDVAKAREAGAEMIVAFPHWGSENSTSITDEQAYFARVYAQQGVDLIVGNHPRVLQPIEVLLRADGHKTVCFYSLGCLTSSLYTQNLLGGFAEVTLNRAEDGTYSVSSATLKPVITHRANEDNYTTYLVSDYSEDLAYNSWDGYLTPYELSRQCTEILGDGFDSYNYEYRVNFDTVVPVDLAAQELIAQQGLNAQGSTQESTQEPTQASTQENTGEYTDGYSNGYTDGYSDEYSTEYTGEYAETQQEW